MSRLHTDEDLALVEASPYKRIVAAMLRVAATDARGKGDYAASARAFLRNQPLVEWWCDLAGFPETTYRRLLKAAGMERDP